jgi:hypothetical protein
MSLEDYNRGRGHPSQEPYKEQLFELCRQAYVSGHCRPRRRLSLTAHSLQSLIDERWGPRHDDPRAASH